MDKKLKFKKDDRVSVDGTVTELEINDNRFVVSSATIIEYRHFNEKYLIFVDDYGEGEGKMVLASEDVLQSELVSSFPVDVGDEIIACESVYQLNAGRLGSRYYSGTGVGVVREIKDEFHSIVFFEKFGNNYDLLALVPNKHIVKKIDVNSSETENLNFYIMQNLNKFIVNYSKFNYGIRVNEITSIENPKEKISARNADSIEYFIYENSNYL